MAVEHPRSKWQRTAALQDLAEKGKSRGIKKCSVPARDASMNQYTNRYFYVSSRLMRLPRKVTVRLAIYFSIGMLFAIFGICARSPLFEWMSYKDLERQVKRNIGPTELQQWATNLLANHAGDAFHHYQDFHGTNVPPELKRVRGHGQRLEIHENAVWIFCGTKGGPFLVVGSPTLVNTNFVPWKPGIYFVGQQYLFNRKH
ncbi:MAG: hypothetical protein JWQ04_3180 [Pedosphaera sp.]|nr:hypothetical protein [Pedosphaera sp.]